MDPSTIAALVGIAVALGLPALGFAAAWGSGRGELKALRESMSTHVAAIERRLADVSDALRQRDAEHESLASKVQQLERQVAILADRAGVTPIASVPVHSPHAIGRTRVHKPGGG